MSKTLYQETKKTRTISYVQLSGYERRIILRRLERTVEKLKEARTEIQQTIQIILRMKENGDDIADQTIRAVAEMYPNVSNPWLPSPGAKTKIKKEAAKPLLLLRTD